MNPVPINETIVPTPNSAERRISYAAACLRPSGLRHARTADVLAKAPVAPINSMIAPSSDTPNPTAKPSQVSFHLLLPT